MQLVIQGLTKTYDNGVQALKGIDLEIPQGMFGLLGPNGAGKSTLMRTIATLQEADAGTIRLDDIDVLKEKEKVRKVLGYLPQEFGVYPKVEADRLLDHIAVLKGITNKTDRSNVVESLLKRTNLWHVRNKSLGTFSGGMKQRFGIAQALIGDPHLVIVDEPTAGLDPAERNRFLNLLSELGEHTIVILSTHIVEDVKELCTAMAIINQGAVLFKGNPSTAVDEVSGKIWKKKIRKNELEDYRKNFNVLSEQLIAGSPEIRVLEHSRPEGFERAEADLEDVYFSQLAEERTQSST
ncbi:MAG TPA: ABC transporter ATP-binding protein [Cyclobacteriaceae bacterium]|nr:ABC transporter ATP-binding protein [Cyclobacteriaceae bacterium]